jgi:hypothetical protein
MANSHPLTSKNPANTMRRGVVSANMKTPALDLQPV